MRSHAVLAYSILVESGVRADVDEPGLAALWMRGFAVCLVQAKTWMKQGLAARWMRGFGCAVCLAPAVRRCLLMCRAGNAEVRRGAGCKCWPLKHQVAHLSDGACRGSTAHGVTAIAQASRTDKPGMSGASYR